MWCHAWYINDYYISVNLVGPKIHQEMVALDLRSNSHRGSCSNCGPLGTLGGPLWTCVDRQTPWIGWDVAPYLYLSWYLNSSLIENLFWQKKNFHSFSFFFASNPQQRWLWKNLKARTPMWEKYFLNVFP